PAVQFRVVLLLSTAVPEMNFDDDPETLNTEPLCALTVTEPLIVPPVQFKVEPELKSKEPVPCIVPPEKLMVLPDVLTGAFTLRMVPDRFTFPTPEKVLPALILFVLP